MAHIYNYTLYIITALLHLFLLFYINFYFIPFLAYIERALKRE